MGIQWKQERQSREISSLPPIEITRLNSEVKPIFNPQKLKKSEKVPEQARYFNEENFVTEKEMTAKPSGLSFPQKKESKKSIKQVAEPSFSEKLYQDVQDSLAEQQENKVDPSQFFVMDQGLSLGHMTLLNSKGLKSASFDRRVYEALVPLWYHEVRKVIERSYSLLSQGDFITHLGVKIDARGRILDVSLLTASGQNLFDGAAREALLKMNAFPNPPEVYRVKKNEYELKFGFQVRLGR